MLTSATQRLVDDFDALLAQDPHDLPDALLLQDTETLLRERRRLDGVIARRLQVLDARDVTTNYRARSTKAWLIEDQHLSRPDAAARMAVARSAVTRPAIVEAMVAGEVSLDHAKTIVAFLPKLTSHEARDHGEKLLLDYAKDADPTSMTAALRGIADQLCLNESAEERAVRMHAERWLRFRDTIGGMVAIDGILDAPDAAIVKTAIGALAVSGGELDHRMPQQRNADALVDLARLGLNSGQLPEVAGEPTQVHVLTDYDDLTRRLQAGGTTRSTIGDVAITPNTVRMLACDAGIIPVVMRGTSEVLDLGRSTRTWSRAQRKAAKVRARNQCEAPRCQAGIARCELHHTEEWAKFGRTDLDNGIYLCTYHHWLTHHTSWTFTRNKDGTVEIRRPDQGYRSVGDG